MQLTFEGSVFTVRRDAAGSITLECDNPKPQRKPGPGERVPVPRAEIFEFEGQRYQIWRDPHNGVQFSRDHRAAKPAKPAPLARESKPKSVAINVTSIVADRHALPQRLPVARAVHVWEASKSKYETVCIRGVWYYAVPTKGGVELHRCLAKQ